MSDSDHPLWKDFVIWHQKVGYCVWYNPPLTSKDLFDAYVAGARKGSELTTQRMLQEQAEIQQDMEWRVMEKEIGKYEKE